jgi:hypothetical protein
MYPQFGLKFEPSNQPRVCPMPELLISWAESSRSSSHVHCFSQGRFCLLFDPDEATVSMQHKVMIQLRHFVPME